MLLDSQTLIVVVIFLAALMAVGMALFGLVSRRFEAYRYWVAFDILTAASMFLTAQRGVILDFFSIVLANALAMGALLAAYEGVACFVGQPSRRVHRGLALGVAVVMAILVFYTYVEPNAKLRALTMSLFGFVGGLCCIEPLCREWCPEMRPAARTMKGVFVLYGTSSLLWGGWVWVRDDVAEFLPGDFGYSLLFFLVMFIQIAAQFGFVWLATKRLEIELHLQARTDPLTATVNRRGLYEVWPRECAQTERHGWPLSIVIMDIDHFKKLNDQFGHQTGDRVLKEAARIWTDTLRATDLLVRMGGEEFLAVLPNAHKIRAYAVAERLRRNLEAAEMPCADQTAKVTASFGVATWREDGDDLDSLISAADRAMYEGKRIGRNRVVLASPVLGECAAEGEVY